MSYFMHGQSTVYSCALHINNMNYYSEQDFSSSLSCDGSESYSDFQDKTSSCYHWIF